MEDFLYCTTLAGEAAKLISVLGVSRPEIANPVVWQQAAEDCVLARMKSLRLIGGLPRHKAPLSKDERIDRLHMLLQLWSDGCTCAVDEDLFADILNRRKMNSSTAPAT